MYVLPGDILCLLRDQVSNKIGNIFRLTELTHGYLGLDSLEHLSCLRSSLAFLGGRQVLGSIDNTQGYSVGGDALPGSFESCCLCQGNNAGFGSE